MLDTKLYYEKNKKQILKQQKAYRTSPHGAYLAVYGCCKRHNFKICNKESFVSWYISQERICYYCKIPEDKLKYLPISYLFKKRFTIDKKDSNKGYYPKNMAFACNLCNMIKSNYFSAEEMVLLARDYITPKWQKMLSEKESIPLSK